MALETDKNPVALITTPDTTKSDFERLIESLRLDVKVASGGTGDSDWELFIRFLDENPVTPKPACDEDRAPTTQDQKDRDWDLFMKELKENPVSQKPAYEEGGAQDATHEEGDDEDWELLMKS